MIYQELFNEYSRIVKPQSKWDIFKRLSSAYKRYALKKRILDYYSQYKAEISEERRAFNVIISLTSFPARLSTIWQCVESLKRQSVTPEKIILYLSKEQVSQSELPSSLINEEDNLFEIRMVDGDIRSHKKYYYAMKEFPDKIIVTTDDDVIYPPFMLSCLLEVHFRYPEDVIANYTHVIKHNNDVIAPYIEWYDLPVSQNKIDKTDNQIQVGIGGVLYPPKSLNSDALNMDLARELSFLADDLWLYAQTIVGGHRVVKSRLNKNTIIPITIKNDRTLTSENVHQNKNDIQFYKLREYYRENYNVDIVKI